MNKEKIKLVETLIDTCHHMSNNIVEADSFGFNSGKDWSITKSKESYKTYMEKEFKEFDLNISKLSDGEVKEAFKNKRNKLMNMFLIVTGIVLVLLFFTIK